eukprot:TRINITY_DN3870_c0_g2_i5.p1 TRINITY_DN3870_c0_g2~~TRINITY_DN3870_c0_g2_i5.p1  ORF type:complete len:459 (-),score=122.21 TRINITY_DN3870_c0_g2_i5:193-1569(-)
MGMFNRALKSRFGILQRGFAKIGGTQGQDLAAELLKMSAKMGEIIDVKAKAKLVGSNVAVITPAARSKDAKIPYNSIVALRGVEKEAPALALDLREDLLGALVLDRAKNVAQFEDNQIDVHAEGRPATFKFGSESFGRVLDVEGKDLSTGQKPTKEKERSLELFRSIRMSAKARRRIKPRRQVYTGSIPIDLCEPIPEGSFVVLHGRRGTGKSLVAGRAVKAFLSEGDRSRRRIVYVSYSRNNCERVLAQAEALDARDRVLCLSIAENREHSSQAFLLPFAGAALAHQLRIDGEDVLLVVEDVVSHLCNELGIFRALKQPFSPISLANELVTISGTFLEGPASLTTLVAFEEEEVQEEFRGEATRLKHSLESLANVWIDFDLSDAAFRRILPKLTPGPNLHTFPWQRSIIRRLSEEKNALELKRELKITVDLYEAANHEPRAEHDTDDSSCFVRSPNS